MGWSREKRRKVVEMLERLDGPEEVAAAMGCTVDQLDGLSAEAFGMPFHDLREQHAAIGRARINEAIWSQAMAGDMKALDMLAREHLGMGAVETRKRNIAAAAPARPPAEVTPLAVIQERAAARRAGAARKGGARAV